MSKQSRLNRAGAGVGAGLWVSGVVENHAVVVAHLIPNVKLQLEMMVMRLVLYREPRVTFSAEEIERKLSRAKAVGVAFKVAVLDAW